MVKINRLIDHKNSDKVQEILYSDLESPKTDHVYMERWFVVTNNHYITVYDNSSIIMNRDRRVFEKYAEENGLELKFLKLYLKPEWLGY